MAGRIYRKHQKRRRAALRNYRRYTLYFDSDFTLERFESCHTQEALWAAQKRGRDEALLKYQKALPYSQTMCQGKGAKPYKHKYHKMRRRQSRLLCRHALLEDQERFDQIAPEGFRGAIDHDIW